MAWLSIYTITCEKVQEVRDEIYIKVGLDYEEPARIWGPRQMNSGESLEIDWRAPADWNEFRQQARIQVWERDYPRFSEKNDDLIGNLRIVAIPRVRQHRFRSGRARYRLSYAVNTESTDVPQWPIRLLRLHCNDAKGTRDDICLTWNGRRIWGPVRMRTGDTRPIDYTVVIREQGSLSLWEQDPVNSDYLDTHVLHAAEESRPDGPAEKRLRFHWRKSDLRDAVYTLYYED